MGVMTAPWRGGWHEGHGQFALFGLRSLPSHDPAATMVRIVEVSLDDTAWCARIDRWIAAHARSTPFHRPAWLRAILRGTGQHGFLLVAMDSQDAIAGLLPVTIVHSPLFGRALVSSGFGVDGGILADRPYVAARLADAGWQAAARHGCTSAELRGGSPPTGEGWLRDESQYLGFAKPLEADDEAQLMAVPRKHRAELRKGLGNGLTIEIGRSDRLLDIHYRLYARNVHRLGTPVFPRSLFASVLAEMGEDADILLVSRDGAPLTTIFTLWHRGACMPFWQGCTSDARALRANDVGYFRLMGIARERGCPLFDFGRSKVGTGPAAWKRSWGWPGVPLVYHHRAIPGYERRNINPLSPKYRAKVELWKRLPLGVANRIGPMIARGLG